MTQEILPPLPAHPDPAEAFTFTPVPRATKRRNGITDHKQRVFIDNLAASGCVKMAADSIGTSTSAMYQLRKRPGAESFAAAWDQAVEAGARRVLDLLMAHAIHGTPETLLKDGEVILERRKFNTRAMMWIVQQRFPEQYGGNLNVGGGRPASSMPDSIRKLKASWQKEWESEQRANARTSSDEAQAIYSRRVNAIRKGFKREIAPDPLKRAAWEILCGPTDWEDCGVVPDYDGLPPCETNHNRPDMIVLAAVHDVDTPDWGLLAAMEQGAFGPDRQAEALEAKRLREG